MAEIGHGGKAIVERIMEPREAAEKIKGLTQIPIRSQIANEVIGLAYGYFTPIEGFMNKADVESVCKNMRLKNGVVWSIPLLFDVSDEEISKYNLKVGNSVVLTYGGNPMAASRSKRYSITTKRPCARRFSVLTRQSTRAVLESTIAKTSSSVEKSLSCNGRKSMLRTIRISYPPLK
jgi:ATP sulfurylase